MFTGKGLIYLYITAWLIMDIKVESYKSGCSGGYCFVVSDTSKSNEYLAQSNAQQWCRSNGTQLVEIRNNDIENSLISFIKSQGLNGWNAMTNGKRSSGSWFRLTGNEAVGITVYDQTDASYAYGYLKSTTSGFDLFASRPSDNKGRFICTGLLDCSDGIKINGQCYKSFTETLSWYEARNRCLVGGGDLASFDHITTNAGFNAINGSWISASNSYWIGIRRERWTWQSSNSDVKYSDWITGHPLNEVSRSYTDCLCVSTLEWKWTECGCNQWLPFVCMSDDKSTIFTTATTTRSTASTIRSTTTTSTIRAASEATSSVASESNGVSSPTITATATSNFIPAGNYTGGMEQSMGLSREATIGIGVGVGVGGALVIIALVAALIILRRKRCCSLRCPQRKTTNSRGRTPDILMKDSANNHQSSDGIDNPYARVVSSSPELNNADTNAYENFNQTPTVYAQLGFCTEPQLHRDGSVTIVSGKTKPFPAPTPPKNKNATNHFKVGGDLYAEVTKA